MSQIQADRQQTHTPRPISSQNIVTKKSHIKFSSTLVNKQTKRVQENIIVLHKSNNLWTVDFGCLLLFRFRRFFIAVPSVCTAGYVQKLGEVCAATTAAGPSFKCVVKYRHSRMMSATAFDINTQPHISCMKQINTVHKTVTVCTISTTLFFIW